MRFFGFFSVVTLSITTVALSGCHNSKPPKSNLASAQAAAVSPLGPSYVLLPLPSDDDQLLGRIVRDDLEPGASLEEISRPNPCAQYLTPPKKLPLANHYEDVQEMEIGAKSAAFFTSFGFSGQASDASHFLYKIETDSREARTDTNEYVQCCKENDCGYGFISALIHGSGVYAAGRRTSAQGGVSVMRVASADGFVKMRVLSKRNVKGWIAALVTITDSKKGRNLGTFSQVAAKAGISEKSLPQHLRAIYENNKISVVTTSGGYEFRRGKTKRITENEFVRSYREMTNSDELDGFETRRNKGTIAFWGLGFVAFGGLTYYGATHLERFCDNDDWANTDCTEEFDKPVDKTRKTTNWAGYTAVVGGGLGMLGTAIPLVIQLGKPDGTPDEHLISDADARFFTMRYNKQLLRKTVRRLKGSSDQVSVRMYPMVSTDGSMGLGFQGTF